MSAGACVDASGCASRVMRHASCFVLHASRQSNPIADALSVAAARVEHSSLRNAFSTWVRTVLGLIESACATCLLLAPREMARRTSISRGDRRGPSCDARAAMRRAAGAPPVTSAATTSPHSRPRAASSCNWAAASASSSAARHGRPSAARPTPAMPRVRALPASAPHRARRGNNRNRPAAHTHTTQAPRLRRARRSAVRRALSSTARAALFPCACRQPRRQVPHVVRHRGLPMP